MEEADVLTSFFPSQCGFCNSKACDDRKASRNMMVFHLCCLYVYPAVYDWLTEIMYKLTTMSSRQYFIVVEHELK